MSCPASHPVRAPDGLLFAPELETIGSHATESWVRCRACGAWFWMSTDIGGKYEYVGAVTLDTALAERAFVDRELDAVARLVVTNDVPYGPIWTTAGALVELFRILTPGATDAARAAALGRVATSSRWPAATELLAKQSRATAQALPVLQFPIDLQVPGYSFAEYFEVGASLVLVPDDKHELLRLDARQVVRLPLAGPARALAASHDRVMFAVATPAGDGIVVLDAAGAATSHPVPHTQYEVTPLDDGWWLFVPTAAGRDRWIELHLPDGKPHVKLTRRFADTAWMPPPRRFAGGWMISNLVDDDGNVQALTLFDAELATAAFSTGIDGERAVTPIDDAAFWASTDGTMERWIRRADTLERVQAFVSRASWQLGDRLITDTGGEVAARASSGEVLWTWQRATTGATYGVATSNGVLLYDDDRAHLLDRDGRVVTSFAVEHPDVRVGSDGTAYVKSTTDLWIVRDHARAITVGEELELEMTSGDDAVLAGPDHCELVSPDAGRAVFHAPGITFSVVGTRSGPYLVEAGRIRVARLAIPSPR